MAVEYLHAGLERTRRCRADHASRGAASLVGQRCCAFTEVALLLLFAAAAGRGNTEQALVFAGWLQAGPQSGCRCARLLQCSPTTMTFSPAAEAQMPDEKLLTAAGAAPQRTAGLCTALRRSGFCCDQMSGANAIEYAARHSRDGRRCHAIARLCQWLAAAGGLARWQRRMRASFALTIILCGCTSGPAATR